MATPLYDTDVIPVGSRPALTELDDADFIVVFDTSTGLLKKITKSNFIANNVDGKADKVGGATEGNLASLDSNGNLADSGVLGTNVSSHIANTDNPHGVTATQVGLGNCDNTADADKPVSTATQTALNLKVNTADIVDDLTTGGTTVPLSAEQGKDLNTRLTTIENSPAVAYNFEIQINEETGDVTLLDDRYGKSFTPATDTSHCVSWADNYYPFYTMHHVKRDSLGNVVHDYDDNYSSATGRIFTEIDTSSVYIKDIHNTSGTIRAIAISNVPRKGYIKATPDRDSILVASMTCGAGYDVQTGLCPLVNVSYTDAITAVMSLDDGKLSMYDMEALHLLYCMTVIESGSLNHKTSYGQGINSGMPYSSSSDYQLTVATSGGNTVTLTDASQPFYAGMYVQVGTSLTNNSYAENRLITDVDTTTTPGSMILTLDGDAFTAPIGASCAAWGQPVSAEAFADMGNDSGYYYQFESATRSHVCYRGIWDLWGNVWQFLAGFMRLDGVYYGCYDRSKYNITDLSTSPDGWYSLGTGSYADNGYQQKREAIELNGHYFDVPKLWGSVAGANTYYCAYLYNFDSTYAGTRVLRVGGDWSNGSVVSPVCSSGNSSRFSASIIVSVRLVA